MAGIAFSCISTRRLIGAELLHGIFSERHVDDVGRSYRLFDLPLCPKETEIVGQTSHVYLAVRRYSVRDHRLEDRTIGQSRRFHDQIDHLIGAGPIETPST